MRKVLWGFIGLAFSAATFAPAIASAATYWD